MTDADAVDFALLLLRCGVGAVMLAHGVNHVWHGNITGTAEWFGSMGMKPAKLHAWAINHRGNGFFIFRPGEGWEYVMVLGLAGIALGTLGPGTWSLDDAFDIIDDLTGTAGLLISAVAGIGGAIALLAVFWRPPTAED